MHEGKRQACVTQRVITDQQEQQESAIPHVAGNESFFIYLSLFSLTHRMIPPARPGKKRA